MRSATIILVICFLLIGSQQMLAQPRHELAASFGGGYLQVNPGGGATTVFSFSYRFHLTRHISAEGAIDAFNYKLLAGPPDDLSEYKDDYLGAEAAFVYYFLSNRDTGRFLPFVVAGIGKTTTDFTEISAHPYYRIGAGVAYNLTEKWGLRFEVRDEIIKSLHIQGNPTGNLPSARIGLVFRL